MYDNFRAACEICIHMYMNQIVVLFAYLSKFSAVFVRVFVCVCESDVMTCQRENVVY